MKFPYISLFIVIIISLLTLSACNANEKTENIENRIDLNVNEIKILNGENGNKFTINNPEEIKNIIEYMKKIKITSTKQEKVKGYSYKIELIKNEKIANTLTLMGKTIKIDKNYYQVNEKEVKELEKMIDKLN